MKTYKNIVITLFEGHYEFGVGTLLNSLVKSEFEGLFCIGYKGCLPFWINQLHLVENESNLYQVSEYIYIRFDELNVDMHFGYYKPYYMKKVYQEYTDANGYFYFDPDILILAKWTFFENWLNSGVALCQDICYDMMHYNHPWRNQWRKDFKQYDQGTSQFWNYYVNSGAIGVDSKTFKIIDSWIMFTETYKKNDLPITYFNQEDTLSPYKGDQDVLNAVLTLNEDIPISVIGKEAMGFAYPISIMVHAIGGDEKPWKMNYLKTAIKGKAAIVADNYFFDFYNGRIKLYSTFKLNRRKLALMTSKLINGFWKK